MFVLDGYTKLHFLLHKTFLEDSMYESFQTHMKPHECKVHFQELATYILNWIFKRLFFTVDMHTTLHHEAKDGESVKVKNIYNLEEKHLTSTRKIFQKMLLKCVFKLYLKREVIINCVFLY